LVELGRYDEAVYRILSDPVTPNEVAKKLGVTQKTAQRVLMHLALTREDVKYKNSGRIHIFWKEKENQELAGSLEGKKKEFSAHLKARAGKCKED
jgi:predicted transcriptional regulator